MSLIAKAKNLQDQVNLLFGGRPFLPGVPPTDPANIRRFNAYLYMLCKTERVLYKALELFATSTRLQNGDDWQKLLKSG